MSFRSLFRALTRRRAAAVPVSLEARSAERIARLRARGARIGEGCVVLTEEFSTEPWLVELGDHVAVAGDVRFLTHDGTAWLFRREHPKLHILGRIRVGDDSFVGQGAILLPGVTVGARCVVGAGAVVREDVPDGSVVLGNPARVVLRTDELKARLLASSRRFDTFGDPPDEVRRVVEARFARS